MNISLPKRLVVLAHNDQRLVINPEIANWVRVDQSEFQVIEGIFQGQQPENIVRDFSYKLGIPINTSQQIVRCLYMKLIANHIIYQSGGHGLRLRVDDSVRVKVVYYSVTNACNLDCPYCFADDKLRLHNELSTLESRNLLEQIADEGVEELVFSGGEPAVRTDLVELVAYASDLGLKVGIITNGTMFDRDMVTKLSQYLSSVSVSLDGASPEVHDRLRGRGNFLKTREAIDYFQANKVRVTLNVTLTYMNYGDILPLHQFAKSLGAGLRTSWQIPMGRGKKWGNKNLTHLARSTMVDLLAHGGSIAYLPDQDREKLIIHGPPQRYVNRKRCSIANSEVAIGSDGNVYPCRLLQLPPFKSGNIRETSFSRIYHESPIMQHYRAFVADDIEKCKKCYLRSFCGGGCPAVSYAHNQNMKHPPQYICFLKHFELELGMWLKTGYQPDTIWGRKCLNYGIGGLDNEIQEEH